MIASLNGTVEAVLGDSLIIDVGGVGFQVYVTTGTLSNNVRIGKNIKLFTCLHVREDNLALYGFDTVEQLNTFKMLTDVSGIGPRLGIAILSAMSVEQLTMAIGTGNADLLTSIPGIGKKLASRLVLELKDKVGKGMVSGELPVFASDNSDVVGALVALGYSTAEASRAVASLPVDNNLDLESKVKLALQYFARK